MRIYYFSCPKFFNDARSAFLSETRVKTRPIIDVAMLNAVSTNITSKKPTSENANMRVSPEPEFNNASSINIYLNLLLFIVFYLKILAQKS